MSADRELRVLLREALQLQAISGSAEAKTSLVEVDPWCKARIICLHAQPSGECLGYFQEFVRPGARKLERIADSLANIVHSAVEYILDPWHEPEVIRGTTPEELAAIRRTAPEEWVPRWKHKVNPPKGVDLKALLMQLDSL